MQINFETLKCQVLPINTPVLLYLCINFIILALSARKVIQQTSRNIFIGTYNFIDIYFFKFINKSLCEYSACERTIRRCN